VTTDQGNVLWDPSGFIDDAAVAAVRSAGGLRFVTASHPHFYGAIASWAREFGAEILVPADDVAWLRAGPELPVRLWSGVLSLLPGVTLVQCGGHFPGSAVLHWAGGAGGRGVLLSGDTIFVTPGEDRVSFIFSAPNRGGRGGGAVRVRPDLWWLVGTGAAVARVGDGPYIRAALHRAPRGCRINPVSDFCIHPPL
jgi:glyoxylase-like metal-dependent hydrolase (beta-lactamase superfamily II)